VIGARVLAHDRRAMHEQLARDRLHSLDELARGFEHDVTEIAEDLELAATLIASAESTSLAERELHAIATIKREYMVMQARRGTETFRVVALDGPAGITEQSDRALGETLDRADRDPGVLKSSGPLGTGVASWYRVFALRTPKGPVVAVAVNTTVLLARLALLRNKNTVAIVVGTNEIASPASDPSLVEAARAPGSIQGLLRDAAHGPTWVSLGAGDAQTLGLPPTAAVATAVPFTIDEGEAWRLVLVTSNVVLQTQERTLIKRFTVGAVLALLLLTAAAAYVVFTSRRAAALTERLRQADKLRKAEERLLHSEKLAAAGQLAAGIAHEIGTPLNIARGRAELALSRLGDHPQAAGQQVIVAQIDRVSRMIQQLLDVARPSHAGTQEIDVLKALDAVVELVSAEAGKRGIAVRVSGDPSVPALRADPDQLQQALLNLVMNAMDACDAGGHVELRASQREGFVVLEIVDDGHGIPAAIQGQVFDPFFSTKKRGQGTGLGLWVVAQVVRSHAGEIEIESTDGTGTTVRIAWPV
jgi:signal transduction histidine kinase